MSSITLGALIKLLESVEKDKFVAHSLENLHSFRGEPAQLAISSGNGTIVANMLEEAKAAVGKTFEGYKGGEYVMTEKTSVNFSFYGSSDEYPHMFFSFINDLFK